MSPPLIHSFTSTIPDDPSAITAGEVTPSRWNAAHLHGMGVFNVITDFGAVGNGVTDDTAAINAAIAAFNAAGTGTLFFPATTGGYLISSSLTTITATGIVRGEGGSNYRDDTHSGVFASASIIKCNSTSAVVFSVTSGSLSFYDIAIQNIAAGVPTSASRGITNTYTALNATINYYNIAVEGFYIGIDIQVGNNWVMEGCIIYFQKQYCVQIQNVVNADAGDWCISNCAFTGSGANPAAACINQHGSGGGKVINCKFNSDTNLGMLDCYDCDLTGSSDLLICNCSAENFGNSFFNGGGQNIIISNVQLISEGAGSVALFVLNGWNNGIISNVIARANASGCYVVNFQTVPLNVQIKNIVCERFIKGIFDPTSFVTGIAYAEDGSFRVASDVSNATTTLATATGLTVGLVSESTSGLTFTYDFEAYLPFTDAAAGGIKVALVSDGILTVSSIRYDGWIVDSGSNGIKGNASSTALGGVVASSTTTGTAGVVVLKGEVSALATGNLLVQFAQNTSNATATVIKAGAWFRFWRAPVAA